LQTNQSATNQFDIQLLYFIEVEGHTMKQRSVLVQAGASKDFILTL
jgi:hypothetical protein